MSHAIHLPGRPAHHAGAKNDCTVRALAETSGLPYDHVNNVLHHAGRRPDRGFDIYRWLHNNDGKVLGCDFIMTLFPDRVRYPASLWLIGNNSHVWWVDANGVQHGADNKWRYCYRVVRNTHDAGPLDLTVRLSRAAILAQL